MNCSFLFNQQLLQIQDVIDGVICSIYFKMAAKKNGINTLNGISLDLVLIKHI